MKDSRLDVDSLLHSPFEPFMLNVSDLRVLQCDAVIGVIRVSNHNITLENTRILLAEHKWFERGVKEAIHIRSLNPSLNGDGGGYNLPPIWNNIIKERLTENGALTTNGEWGRWGAF